MVVLVVDFTVLWLTGKVRFEEDRALPREGSYVVAVAVAVAVAVVERFKDIAGVRVLLSSGVLYVSPVLLGRGRLLTILNESGENMIQIDEHLRVTDECVSMLPRCPKCDAYARPHVSHSTDYPEDVVPTRKSRQERALVDWLESIGNKKLVVLEVGCGTSIHSLRSETEIIIGKRQMIEKDEGATTLIRIDPGNADVPVGHVGVRMKAMEALVGIEKEILMM